MCCWSNILYGDTIILCRRFPKDVLTSNTWVERSGNHKLLNITMNKVYQCLIMYDKHFVFFNLSFVIYFLHNKYNYIF